MKKIILCVVSLMLASCAGAFDKEKFQEHLLSALNQAEEIKMEIGDPRKSEIKGLLEVTVKFPNQETVVYLSKDKKKYIWGTSFEMAVDYDQKRLSQIDLENAWAKGDKNAPVTIVEFSDLQCGYCRKAHLAFEKELYEMYKPSEVRWVYKHFPLRNHKWSKDGAVAAECAGQQDEGAFWDMMHLLFENAKKTNKENFEETVMGYLKDLKLDKEKFDACVATEAPSHRVQSNHEEGVKVGVRSTPTLVINGRGLRGFKSMEKLKPVIDARLKKAK